jgi:hypothetical protein
VHDIRFDLPVSREIFPPSLATDGLIKHYAEFKALVGAGIAKKMLSQAIALGGGKVGVSIDKKPNRFALGESFMDGLDRYFEDLRSKQTDIEDAVLGDLRIQRKNLTSPLNFRATRL